jgi:hypothetical protein
MNTARSDAAVAVLDGEVGPELYVIGGRNTRGAPLDVVEKFNVAKNAWEPVASLREERYYAAAAVLDGQILLMGGSEEGEEASDDVEVYVPGERDWESFDNLAVERNGLAAAVVYGKVFALGGASEDGVFLRSCESFDPALDHWGLYAPWALDPGRASFGAAVVGEEVYMAGGFDSVGPIGQVERYVFSNGSETLAPLSSPRGSLALVSTEGDLGGDLFVIGGWDGYRTFDTVERYDIEKDAWEAVAPLQTARRGAVAAYIDGTIYVVGGRDEVGNALRTMEVYASESVDEEEGAAPASFALAAAYPNPFTDRTTLSFELAEAGATTLTVYDVRGRVVTTLVDRVMSAGEHRVTWEGTTSDGRPAPAGIYVARLTGNRGQAVEKLTLLR